MARPPLLEGRATAACWGAGPSLEEGREADLPALVEAGGAYESARLAYADPAAGCAVYESARLL